MAVIKVSWDDSDGAISILYIEIGGNTPIEKPVNTEYVAE